MNEDWSTDPPPTPSPRSVAAMWMFGLLFFVLVIVPVGLVIYILIDSLASVGPSTTGGTKPGIQHILTGLTALAAGLVAVFILQWFLLKAVFARLTVEGEMSDPSATTEEEPSESPPKPL